MPPLTPDPAAPARRTRLWSAELAGTAASTNLDLLRGLAALAVFAGHLRGLLFADYAAVARPNPVLRALYFATGLGHQAVMVFFVLSGFLIARSAARAVRSRRWSLRAYALNRLTRLYVVLVPALVAGALWDRTGISLFGTGGIYGQKLNHVIYFAVPPRLTLPAFAGNLFYLQTIVVPAFGSNGALWSLANEFWYYAVFALIVTAATANRTALGLLALAAAALILRAAGFDIALYFLIWLAGAALNLLPLIERRRGLALAAGFLAIAVALALARSASPTAADFIVGVASCVLVYALALRAAPARAGRCSAIARLLASMSYTLYLVHLPMLVFLAGWFVPPARWQPDAPHLAGAASIAIAVLLYARIVANLTEARTAAVRVRLSALSRAA